MNIKKILLTGLKVVAAGVAGFFAFLGLGKLTDEKQQNVVEKPQQQEAVMTEWGVMPVAQVGRETTGVTVVNTLSKAQSVTGKVAGLIQSMAMFAESTVRLFDEEGSQRLNFQAGNSSFTAQERGPLDYPGMPPVGATGMYNGCKYRRTANGIILL